LEQKSTHNIALALTAIPVQNAKVPHAQMNFADYAVYQDLTASTHK
jgi:hypothetical protein